MPSSNRALAVALPIVACVFASALATGCRTTNVADSALSRHPGNEPEAQLDYWHELATKRLVSNDEAFHGLLLYLDESDPSDSYAQRVATLKNRKLLHRDFNRPANEALERGTL